MTSTPQFISEPAGQVPVAAVSDLVVVGGGPAGIAAARWPAPATASA